MTFEHETADELIDRQDAIEILDGYEHNFTEKNGPYPVMTGSVDKSADESYDMNKATWSTRKRGVESAVDTLMGRGFDEEPVVEVVTDDIGYSGNNPSHISVVDEGVMHGEDDYTFSDAFNAIREGFGSDEDATAATGVGLALVETALREGDYRLDEDSGRNLHGQPRDVEAAYDVEIAHDAVQQAFQPKSFRQRMADLI